VVVIILFGPRALGAASCPRTGARPRGKFVRLLKFNLFGWFSNDSGDRTISGNPPKTPLIYVKGEGIVFNEPRWWRCRRISRGLARVSRFARMRKKCSGGSHAGSIFAIPAALSDGGYFYRPTSRETRKAWLRYFHPEDSHIGQPWSVPRPPRYRPSLCAGRDNRIGKTAASGAKKFLSS